jgi:hypothetical protein
VVLPGFFKQDQPISTLNENPMTDAARSLAVGPLLLFAGAACANDPVAGTPDFQELNCSISQSALLNGGPGKDGIPALTNPSFVRFGDSETDYLRPEDRVVGIIRDGDPLAIPLNIFWWHEIVNLDQNGPAISITHCPLTGSTLAFDRSAAGGAEFGVSGLLFQNNLVMYDRTTGESLWPQMARGARCGPADGTGLDMVPIVEMTWEGWRTLHPDTRVVSKGTGFLRDYSTYPYGDYDSPDNPRLLFPGSIDDRRPPKERVLGIPMGEGGIAFPYGLLAEQGEVAAIEIGLTGEPVVVFWDAAREAAMAFRARNGSETLTFSVVDGTIVDDQTGSEWTVDGQATDGPMAGNALTPVAEAFVAFWFAWPTFYPEVEIWSTP